MAARKVDDLGPALDLIQQPLVLEVLVAVATGKQLEDVPSADAGAARLDAAVGRLVTIGAVRLSIDGAGRTYELTGRGTRLLRLLEELDAVMPAPACHDA